MSSRNFFWLLLLAAMWGPSFLFIKVAVAEIPSLTLVTGRVGIAAAVLYLCLRLRGGRLPSAARMWGHFMVLGFFAHALPFVLFSWGEIYIDSAMASILNGTTPLFTIVLAHFFISEERMTASMLTGTIAGMFGLLSLVYPSIRHGVNASSLGVIAVAAAAFSYAVAIVYARRRLTGLPPLVAPTAQLLSASLMIAPLALVLENPLQLATPSMAAFGSVAALAIFGTAIAFVLYYRIMESAGATYLSMVTYIVPVFGVGLGVFLLNERLQWSTYLGFGLILLGVMLVQGILRMPARRLLFWRLQAQTEPE